MLDWTTTIAPETARSPARTLPAMVALLTLLGFVLRLLAARGDLWLDEIWSFTIVDKTHGFGDVVLALPYDNNHVLNSLWLKLVGDDAPSLLVRLPAILFGTLCIPVAARLGARVSPLAALATAALVAIDDVFVQFASEARGYAGLVLALLVALDAIETRLADTTSRRSLAILALAIAFGTFSHLIMLEATCLLGATAIIRLILAEGLRGPWPRRVAPILLAMTIGTLPALACFAVSLTSGPLHVGLSTPFSWATFAEGLGGMVRVVLGIWPTPLPRTGAAILLTITGVAIVLLLPMLPPQRRVLPAVALLGLPLMHAALHLPSQLYARFHLVTGVCLALFVAEVLARGWRKTGTARALALVAALGVLAGQAAQLARFLVEGRGQFAAATALMTRQGPARVAALPAVAAPETAAVMRWYAARAGSAPGVTLVPDAALCTSPPDWLVIVHRPDDGQDVDDEARLRQLPCANAFAPAAIYTGYGLSGFAWTVLHRRAAS